MPIVLTMRCDVHTSRTKVKCIFYLLQRGNSPAVENSHPLLNKLLLQVSPLSCVIYEAVIFLVMLSIVFNLEVARACEEERKMKVIVEILVLISNAHYQLPHILVSFQLTFLHKLTPLDILDQLVLLLIFLRNLTIKLKDDFFKLFEIEFFETLMVLLREQCFLLNVEFRLLNFLNNLRIAFH